MSSEDTLIETRGLTKNFGGLIAVNGVNFKIKRGDIVGIIGPNGAGKTTFINLVTGYLPPTRGEVLYKGRNITQLSPVDRVKLGIARTFQLASIFNSLSVIENLMLGLISLHMEFKRPSTFYFRELKKLRELEDRSFEILRLVGLEELAHTHAGSLPYGFKRKLEIAMALSLNPEILFIDEAFAGLSEPEIESLLEILKSISEKITLVIVEHKVSWIEKLVHRLVVMHEGRIISEGSPQKVLNDPIVQEVYWKVLKVG